MESEKKKPKPISNPSRRIWGDVLRRAVLQADGKKLRAIADALIDRAAEGDVSAIKELGDRLDGKVNQGLTLAGDPDGEPINHAIKVTFVRSQVTG